MKRVRFLAGARLEYLAEVAYYAKTGAGLSVRFTRAVEEAASRAILFPLAGSPDEGEVRRILLRDFPFALVYRPEADGVLVVALAHHRRKPGYWRSR